jgi:hypothetical protein
MKSLRDAARLDGKAMLQPTAAVQSSERAGLMALEVSGEAEASPRENQKPGACGGEWSGSLRKHAAALD